MIRDNLTASREYALRVFQRDREMRYPIYVWNFMPPSAGSIIHPHVQIMVEFMPPSAGSIIHPHVQIMVEREPTPQQRRLLEKSKQYFQKNGTNYWRDLIEKEKRNGDRFIGETGSVSVTASFAPRGFNEVQFTFHEVGSLAELGHSLAELGKREINDFADCLLRVLRGYKKIGVGSFNLASYSAPIKEAPDYYCLNMKLISRPFPRGVYTNDTGPMERLYDVWVIDTLPETLAGMHELLNHLVVPFPCDHPQVVVVSPWYGEDFFFFGSGVLVERYPLTYGYQGVVLGVDN